MSQEDAHVATRILETIGAARVVTERELKIRLEKEFFPWVVGRILGLLINAKKIAKKGYPGRKRFGRGAPQYFYMTVETKYSEVVGLIQQKRSVTAYLNAQLTAESVGGYHAQNLFDEGLQSAGFDVIDRDVSEYKGRKVKAIEGKEPPNIDFVACRDGVEYGIDIKNWVYYEVETREEVK